VAHRAGTGVSPAEKSPRRAKLGAARPGKERAKTEVLEEGLGRLVVDLPASIYRKMKIRCAERGITLKAYLLELLAENGIGKEE
jgi:hypothetical protein